MSEKRHSLHNHIENTDNENTNTIYIPLELVHPQQPQQPQQSEPRPIPKLQQEEPLPNLKYKGNQSQQQSNNQNQQYYNNPQYQNQNQQYYNNPQYQNQNQQYYNPQQNQNQNVYYATGQQQMRTNNNNQNVKKKKSPPKQQPQKKKKKKHKSILGRIIKRILSFLFVLFLIIFGAYSCTSVSLIKKMNYEETGVRSRDNTAMSASYVTSILLIGTDGRTSDELGRSDTMILLSRNSRSKQIVLTSFMRDCYVNIPNYGWDKLNSAYSYGGAELLMDTIENNFGIKIDDYISVDFISFANIIDSVGGVEITVSEEEAQEINTILMAEVNELMGDDVMSDLLESGGKILLNGKQALSYARIRNVGNSDFDRTERQRNVMTLLMNKLKSFKPSMLQKITQNVLPRVTTNVPSTDMYLLSLKIPLTIGYATKQIQIPTDGTFYNDYDDYAGSVLNIDFQANHDILKSEIFE